VWICVPALSTQRACGRPRDAVNNAGGEWDHRIITQSDTAVDELLIDPDTCWQVALANAPMDGLALCLLYQCLPTYHATRDVCSVRAAVHV